MPVQRRMLVAMAAAFGSGVLVAGLVWLASVSANDAAIANARPVWTEAAWPFPVDQWGKGKAFHCRKADCGAEAHLYIRAKLGFCNCTTGVADDDELERLSDFDLMGTRIARLGDGRSIKIAWMNGRSRSYSILTPVRAGQSGLSIAFNDRCDAIVATIVLDHPRPHTIEQAGLEFLNSKKILEWAEVTLGL